MDAFAPRDLHQESQKSKLRGLPSFGAGSSRAYDDSGYFPQYHFLSRTSMPRSVPSRCLKKAAFRIGMLQRGRVVGRQGDESVPCLPLSLAGMLRRLGSEATVNAKRRQRNSTAVEGCDQKWRSSCVVEGLALR